MRGVRPTECCQLDVSSDQLLDGETGHLRLAYLLYTMNLLLAQLTNTGAQRSMPATYFMSASDKNHKVVCYDHLLLEERDCTRQTARCLLVTKRLLYSGNPTLKQNF